MYELISGDYDRFVNWPGRLGLEMPFIEAQINAVRVDQQIGRDRPPRVLDAACGTGMHAIELARRGNFVSGADLSAGMIAQAVKNAQEAQVQVDFRVAGFGELSSSYSDFDVLLCLGNSLPHLLTAKDLSRALADFAACLRPGGRLLIQNRNFDLVLDQHARWMGPELYSSTQGDWLFLRFYDFDPDGLITFNMLTLKRLTQGQWEQKAHSTRLYPQRALELSAELQAAGFGDIQLYGGMAGGRFDPRSSGNLVVVAQLADLK